MFILEYLRHCIRCSRWIQGWAGHWYYPQRSWNLIWNAGCKQFCKYSTTQKEVNLKSMHKEDPYEDQKKTQALLKRINEGLAEKIAVDFHVQRWEGFYFDWGNWRPTRQIKIRNESKKSGWSLHYWYSFWWTLKYTKYFNWYTLMCDWIVGYVKY